jgi:hypothetical protein
MFDGLKWCLGVLFGAVYSSKKVNGEKCNDMPLPLPTALLLG